jgi:hypothetical protein
VPPSGFADLAVDSRRVSVSTIGERDALTPGISPAELAARANHRPRSLSADALERWLVNRGFATVEAGLLRPTSEGLALGDAIRTYLVLYAVRSAA